MTENPDIVGTFTGMIDSPDLPGHFWFAALRGIAFVGCLCGVVLLGAVVAQSLGLFFI